MARPRYRAWRFVHPDFDVQESSVGLRVAATGGMDMVSDNASIRQAVLILLSTIPGERIMRPTYGCELYKIVFMPNDATTHGLAIHCVRQALERWEPRIDILRVDADANEVDPHRVDVVLEYRVPLTLREEQVIISLNLS